MFNRVSTSKCSYIEGDEVFIIFRLLSIWPGSGTVGFAVFLRESTAEYMVWIHGNGPEESSIG